MPDAVIVSTARTPIGRAFKGTLVDVDPFTLAEHVVTAAVERSGLDACAGRRHDPRRVPLRRRRHRPLRRRRDRHGADPRRGGEPSLRRRSHRRHHGRRLDPRRHGQRRHRRGHPLDVHLAPLEAPGARQHRGRGLDVAQPPRHAHRAEPRHVDHRRLERGRRGRREPRGDGRLGRSLPRACPRRHRQRRVRGRDRPDRGEGGRRVDHPVRRRRVPPPGHHGREAGRRSRSCTRRSRASASPPATRRASTTLPPRW